MPPKVKVDPFIYHMNRHKAAIKLRDAMLKKLRKMAAGKKKTKKPAGATKKPRRR